MCENGCTVDETTRRCTQCGAALTDIMMRLGVPRQDQEHTWKTLREHTRKKED